MQNDSLMQLLMRYIRIVAFYEGVKRFISFEKAKGLEDEIIVIEKELMKADLVYRLKDFL